MHPGERAALEGILNLLKPSLAIEIGTFRGGSLERLSEHCHEVHAIDLTLRPEITADRFPAVRFHEGDSHALLPSMLEAFADAGRNVDFALVDGDHSGPGVMRDVVDLLDSPATGQTVIVVHDTLSVRVRSGLEQIAFAEYQKVGYVDLDFVQGNVRAEGQSKDDLWCGLGLIVTGQTVDHPWPRTYPAPDVYRAFARSRADDGSPIGDRQMRRLEDDLAVQRSLVALMESSLSWRLTSPLRRLRVASPRGRGRSGR
jgi:hypothetical protein